MTTEQKKILLKLKQEPRVIGEQAGFGHFSDIHNEWIKSLIFGTDDYTLQAHRGSFKSTCSSIANALFMVLYPSKNSILIRKTDNDVSESIKQTANVLNSEFLKEITYRLYGIDLQLIEESQYKLTTNLYFSPRGASQLLGQGINGSLTGKHADRIITDDIINIKDRISQAEREHTKIVYMELQNIKNRDGRIVNLGTPWHKDDAFSIMPEAERYDVYSTGLVDKWQIAKLRETMSPSLFCANYELKHIASENALFTQSPTFTDDYKLLYNGIAHIDAAYGGEDYSALTLARLVKGKIYVFGKLQNRHIDNALGEYLTYCKEYRCQLIYCEKNADKGYLAKGIRSRNFATNSYNESMNKYYKISTYLRKWWKDIVFIDGTDPDYINQIMDYTEQASHDDAPDSLASICRTLDKSDFRGL